MKNRISNINIRYQIATEIKKTEKDAKIITSGLLRYYAIIFPECSFYRCSENPDKRQGKKPGRSRVVGGQLTLMKRSVPTRCLKTKRAEIVDKLRAKGAYVVTTCNTRRTVFRSFASFLKLPSFPDARNVACGLVLSRH